MITLVSAKILALFAALLAGPPRTILLPGEGQGSLVGKDRHHNKHTLTIVGKDRYNTDGIKLKVATRNLYWSLQDDVKTCYG